MSKYIIVRTFCDDIGNANEIINYLLDNKLIVASQITEVYSKYWWNNYLEESKEYKLEFRTKESKYKQIEDVIKEKHNYKLPEVSYSELHGSKEFEEWIDKFVED